MMRPATRTLTRGLSSSSAVLSEYVGQNLRNGVGEFVLARIGLLSESFNLLQLLAAAVRRSFRRVPKGSLFSDHANVNSDYKQEGDEARGIESKAG